jgi:hypothetical protein
MKKLAILLSMISLITNQSCDSTDEEIDFQGNNLFELQFINAGMSGEIIEKKDLEFNEFIELTSNNHFVKRRVYPAYPPKARIRYSTTLSPRWSVGTKYINRN